MVNTEIIKKMLQDTYHQTAYTDKYILVYTYDGVVYMTFTDAEMVNRVTCLDKASRGAGFSLRFKPNKKQKEMLLACGATALCSAVFFDGLFQNSKYNRGEIAEKIVTEYFSQVWEKDTIPYTDAGDIVISGIHYQIKYEKATFTNEKTIDNIRKA